MLGSSLEAMLHRVVQGDMKGIHMQQNTNVATTVDLYAHETIPYSCCGLTWQECRHVWDASVKPEKQTMHNIFCS